VFAIKLRITLVALRNIEAEEELSAQYGENTWVDKAKAGGPNQKKYG
jgi:hypothetical protein